MKSRDELLKRIETLEKALKPFAEMDPNNIDPRLNDKISDWFAPSDFKTAFLAYVDLASPTKE